MAGRLDYFISHTEADAALAATMADWLREAGLTPHLQAEFGPADFMRQMESGFESGARMIALASAAYQRSEYCRKEYNTALHGDPNNLERRVIVFRVEPYTPHGMLATLPYTDLTPILGDAPAMRRVFRIAIGLDRAEADLRAWAEFRRHANKIRHHEIKPMKGFQPRPDLFRFLDDALSDGADGAAVLRNSGETMVAMRGMGGVGKTALAKQYAWARQERYQGLWWVRAQQEETLIEDIAALGRRIAPDMAALDPEDAAEMTLERISQSRDPLPWLIVYDNVDRAEGQALLRRFAPSDKAHLLITSRLAEWHGEATEIPVDVFSEQAAIDFLLAQARKSETPDSAAALARALDRLPLALAHARSYCWGAHLAFGDYVARLPELIRRAPKSAAYPTPVYVAFDLALSRAVEEAPAAEAAMDLIAFCAPERIPLWLLNKLPAQEGASDGSGLIDPLALSDALAALAGLSLITIETSADDETFLSTHRLVLEVARGRLAEKGALEAASIDAALLIQKAYDASGQDGASLRNTALLPHLEAAADLGPQTGAAAYHSFWSHLQAGDVLVERGFLEPALQRHSAALALTERLRATDPANAQWRGHLAVAHQRIGDVVAALGRLEEAKASYETSLDIGEALAAEDPANPVWRRDLSVGHNKIGEILLTEERLEGAEAAFLAALALAEALVAEEPDSPGARRDLSVCQDRIGDVYEAQGRLEEAKSAFQAALRIAQALSEEDPGNAEMRRDLSVSHERIGDLLEAQQRYGAAKAAYQASLDIREALAASDPGAAGWRRDLWVALLRLSRVDPLEAPTHLRRALDLVREMVEAGTLAPGEAHWVGRIEAMLQAVEDPPAPAAPPNPAEDAPSAAAPDESAPSPTFSPTPSPTPLPTPSPARRPFWRRLLARRRP